MESISIAENSEDEGMLQMLKTMDSLETKVSQFQNAVKLFYTSSGLEETIKGIVDFGTGVVNFMNNLPKLGKIPITALMNIINVISLLKNVILGMLVEIKNNFDRQMEVIKQTSQKTGSEAGDSFTKGFNNALRGIKTGLGIDENSSGAQKWGSIARAAGAGATVLGTAVGAKNQRAGTTISGVGSLAMGIGGIVAGFGNPIAMIGGAATALSGLTQVIEGLHVSTEEKIAQLSQEAEELSNEAIKRKSEYNTLKSSVEKYRQLAEAQYDSAEAAQEFKDYQQELMATYPELIEGIEGATNATINAEEMERKLREARQETADATAEKTKKELEEKREEKKQLLEELEEPADWLKSIFFSEYVPFTEIEGSLNDKSFRIGSKGIYYNQNGFAEFQFKTDDSGNPVPSIAFNDEQDSKYKELMRRKTELINAEVFDENYYLELFSWYRDLQNLLAEAFPEGTDFGFGGGAEAFKEASVLLNDIDKTNEQLKNLDESNKVAQITSKLGSLIQGGDPLIKYFDEATGLYSFFVEAIQNKYDELGEEKPAFEDYLSSVRGEDEITGLYDEYVSWYEALSSSEQELFNQMVANPDKYSADDIIKTFGIDKEDTLGKAIASNYAERAQAIQERMAEKITQDGRVSRVVNAREGAIEGIDTQSEEMLFTTAMKQAQVYYDKGFKELGDKYLNLFLTFFETISGYEPTEQATLIDALNGADLTTKTGIQDFIDSLDKMEFLDDQEKGVFLDLFGNLGTAVLTNITTEVGLLQDSVAEKSKKLSDNVSKLAGSLSPDDAMTMFQTLQASGIALDKSFSELFIPDPDDATKFVLSSSDYLQQYVNASTQTLQAQGEALKDAVEGLEGVERFNVLDIVSRSLKNTLQKFGESAFWGQVIGLGYLTDEQHQALAALGLEEEFKAYVLNPVDDNWEAFVKAYDARCESANAEIESINQIINDYPNNILAEALIEQKHFKEAIALGNETGNQGIIERATKEWRTARNELLSTFFTDGVTAIQSSMSSYTRTDLESMATALTGANGFADAQLFLKNFEGLVEEYNDLYTQMLDASTKNNIGEAKDALSKLDFTHKNGGYGSLEDIKSLADALGIKVSSILGEYNEEIGAYEFALDETVISQIDTLGDVISDKIIDTFSEITKLISTTSLTGADKNKLSGLLGGYGISISDTDFTQTAEGFKLTETSAYRIVGELQQINGLAAKATVEELAKSAKDSDERLNDVFYVMERIVEINKELENANISDARRKELKGELAVAQELNRELQKANDTFNFMKGSIPSGWDDPISALEGLGKAFKVIDGKDFANGYMSIDNFYNMISFAGDEILATCGTTNKQLKTAEGLLNAGLTALTTVDGDLVVDLSKLGAGFSLGAKGMKEGIVDALHTLAQSQIDILDAEIQMLDTVVKTQEAFKSISGEDNVIDVGDLVPEINPKTGEQKFNKEQQKVFNFFADYANAIVLATKDGATTTFSELVKNPALWSDLTSSSQELIASLANSVMNALSNVDWSTLTGEDATILQDTLNSVLQQYGYQITIDPSQLLQTVKVKDATEDNPLVKKIADALGVDTGAVVSAIESSGKTELSVGEIIDIVPDTDDNLKAQAKQAMATSFSEVTFDAVLKIVINDDGTIIDENGNVVSIETYKQNKLNEINTKLRENSEQQISIEPTMTIDGTRYQVSGVEGTFNSYGEALDAALSSKKATEVLQTDASTTADVEVSPNSVSIKEGEGISEDGSLQITDSISKATVNVDELEVIPKNVSFGDEGLQVENQQVQLDVSPNVSSTLATLSSLNLNEMATSLANMVISGETLVDLQFDNFANLETATQTAEQAVNNIAQKISEMTGQTITINVVEQGNGVDGNGNATHTTTYSFNTENLTTAVSQVQSATSTATSSLNNIANAINRIPTDSKIPGNVNKTAESIRNLPKDKRVRVSVSVPNKVALNAEATLTVKVQGGSATVVSGITKKTFTSPLSGNITTSQAKGNIALVKGTKTLMGELGPELVVSDGKYFLAGENGAEFVNLADDAIVFNHLQTKRLLANGSTGRGTAVTNEKKATAYAKGNAMASASDALAELKRIRSMWQALLDKSASDLGKKAGSGGGGKGDKPKVITHDLERWYNLLRQIAKYEQQITLEQAKRENLQSGYKYVDSLEHELEILRKQEKAYRQLSSIQKDWYEIRRKELLNTDFAKIFTYDEEGLQQYVDGTDRGLDILAKLNSTDATGAPTGVGANSEAQINYLKSIGFDVEKYLRTKDDGTTAKTTNDMMQNFWDRVDGWMEELDGLYDEYNDHLNNIEENISNQNEILQEYIDNQLSVEEKMLTAITDARQAEIDKMQDILDATQNATDKYISGLSDALNKERNLYNDNQSQQELSKLQRQLAILQRSGGSASEIKNLQDQIDSKLQDDYFNAMQKQIDAIQEASDNQIKKLQEQIDIATEALEYQKENGLLWEQVYQMMNEWTPEKMLEFIEKYTASYREDSGLQSQENSKETKKELEIWAGKRDLAARDNAWETYFSNANYEQSIKEANKAEAQNAFNEAFANGGAEAGARAADAIFERASQKPSTPSPSTPEPTPSPSTPGAGTATGNGTIKTTKGERLNVRSSPSTSASILGKLANGASAVLTGYNGKWYRIDYNGQSGYIYADYVSTSDKDKLPRFARGGLIDFTGPAWVDGSKQKPEAILSAEDTALLRNKIFGNGDNSLMACVRSIQELANNCAVVKEGNSGVNIENINIEVAPGTISNDYSARKAGQEIMDEILSIAKKSGNLTLARR